MGITRTETPDYPPALDRLRARAIRSRTALLIAEAEPKLFLVPTYRPKYELSRPQRLA